MKTQVNEVMKIIQHTKVKFNKDIESFMKNKTKIKNSSEKQKTNQKDSKVSLTNRWKDTEKDPRQTG